ncbi:MAG: hypothetical protein JKY16_05310, partial [Lutibacter sp.]|nr:hypothetical protein [Lutibacter sp.]
MRQAWEILKYKEMIHSEKQMKKIFFSIVLLFGLVGFSQTSDKLFSDANNLYQKGNYADAIELYSSIEKQGLKSDDLFFNLGNCY